MPRAVLFDIDDTLHDWWASFRLAVEAMRPLLPPDQRATAVDRLREVMVAEAYERTGEPYENRVHWRMFVEPEPILAIAFPGVDPRLLADALRAAGPPVRFDDVEPCLAALRDAYALGVPSPPDSRRSGSTGSTTRSSRPTGRDGSARWLSCRRCSTRSELAR